MRLFGEDGKKRRTRFAVMIAVVAGAVSGATVAAAADSADAPSGCKFEPETNCSFAKL